MNVSLVLGISSMHGFCGFKAHVHTTLVSICIANIVFKYYFIAATAAVTSEVVNQWLLVVIARIVLKGITNSTYGCLLSSRCCTAAVEKLMGFEGLAKHTGA